MQRHIRRCMLLLRRWKLQDLLWLRSLHIVLDEHARRFGVGRPAVARVAGRTSCTLQPSLGRDQGSTAPDSSGTAELTEALHRQRGGTGCANGTERPLGCARASQGSAPSTRATPTATCSLTRYVNATYYAHASTTTTAKCSLFFFCFFF